jgi:dihydrofolate reductase
MAAYWPTPAASANDPMMAEGINSATKIVFSRTLDSVTWGSWNNARLVKANIGDEIAALKQQPGKDIMIFGSGSIVSALTNLGLIDEYQLLVVPVILGKGKPEFDSLSAAVKLKLLDAKPFKTGVVLLTYATEAR